MNIGYFINSILPARIGDITKAVMIAEKNNISKTSSLASIAFERLFDLLGLSMVFLTSLFVLDLPSYIKKGGIAVSVLVLAMSLVLLILSKHSKAFYRYFSRFSQKKIYLWIIERFELLFSYSFVFRNKRIIFGVLAATTLSWFLYVYAGYVIIEKIAPGPFSWHVSLLSLILISISFILPTTPGNIGVYQYACVLAFSIAGMSKEYAIVFSLISQIPVYLFNILLGLYSMGLEGITKKRITKLSSDNSI